MARRLRVLIPTAAAMLFGIVGVAYADVDRVGEWIPYGGADAAGHCPDVAVIGARGSGQSSVDSGGLGSQVWEIYEGLAAALETSELLVSTTSIGFLDVPYQAPALHQLFSFIGISAYDASVAEGVALTQAAVQRTALHCPNSRIVLAGYSAGADVIGDALRVLEGWADNIAGVILIADPQFTPLEASAVVYGFSGHAEDGFAGGRALPLWVADVPAFTICHTQDIVCQGAEVSNLLPSVLELEAAPVHTDSTYHGAPREAAVELGGILASLLAQDAENRPSVPDAGSAGVSTFVLLDRSGSMGDRDASGTVKLDGARAGLKELLEAAPASSRFGVSIYPTPGTDCGAGAVLAPLGSVQANDDFLSRVAGVAAGGQTPTGEALRAVARNLPSSLGPRAVVLISDGESNCEGDACGVARQLVGEGFDVRVHTYGFAVSPEGAAELNCISQATGGTYFGIEDAARLSAELERLTEPKLSLLVEQTASVGEDGNPIGVVTVSVSNEGIGGQLHNLTLAVAADKGDPPAESLIHLGNLSAGHTSRQYVWRIPAGQECGPSSLNFIVTAAAENSDPVVSAGSIDSAAADSAVHLCDLLTAPGLDPAPFALSAFVGILIVGAWIVWKP